MSLSEGSFFGEFRVVRRLGKGGMGEVWLLRSPMGEEVAAKLEGIQCRGGTSCPDQLSKAIRACQAERSAS